LTAAPGRLIIQKNIEEGAMSRIMFRMQREFCGECSLALRRFIGGMDGVNAVEVENGAVAIDFDERKIPEEQVQKLARDSIEKLGYRVDED
jgi:copper chaperone CopZ